MGAIAFSLVLAAEKKKIAKLKWETATTKKYKTNNRQLSVDVNLREMLTICLFSLLNVLPLFLTRACLCDIC